MCPTQTNSWGVSTFVNFTGQQLASQTNRGPSPNDTREFDHYNAYATVNMNVFFKTENDFRFNLSVTNLTNRFGQTYYGYLIPAAISDSIGRRFSVSVQKSF